ncbi:MAG TPA: hypothetical protein PKE12_01215 [Kiritimatiellia bacterium]|nr:hypothetical protein [Kiritimatiellia bacterium]
MKKTLGPLLAAALLPIGGAVAHHALEFIELESYSTSRKGEWLFHLHYDFMSEDKNDPRQDHWEITPGLAYGITDRLMFDVHGHYAKFENGLVLEERQAEFEPNGPSPFFEAMAFTLQYRVTEGAPVDVAVSGTFELPMERAKDLLGSEEVYAASLILTRNFGVHGNITLNLGSEWEGGEDSQSWGIGIRESLTGQPHGTAAGIEFLGAFDDFEDSWSVLPGIYIPINEQTILKTGFEVGKGADYTRANITLMHRF